MPGIQPSITRYLLFSKQFNFGDAGRVTREISGGFYGLHLHNMHKLISLERIKDYGTKIALSRKSKRIWISKDKKRKKDHKIEMTQFQGMVLYRKPGARGSKWHCHKFIRRNYEKFQLISNNHSTQLVKPAQLHKRWMYKVHRPKIALTWEEKAQACISAFSKTDPKWSNVWRNQKQNWSFLD